MNSIIFATVLALIPSVIIAHNPDIDGVVIDTQGKPVPFANVSLLTSDSTFVQGCLTQDDGHFGIVCDVEDYILRITCIGYETTYLPTSNYDGTIVIHEKATTLSDVVVKGQRPITKVTGNSMVTTIQGSVLEKSGSAKEMLAKVPGMIQKGDELEVLGKGTPIYYINGRKVNNKEELKRLRSEEIKEVEVITNPGAQYNASVSSVVRIKTIKREGTGFGYDYTLSHQQNLRYGYADPGTTLDLQYRCQNIELFGMLNYWKWDSMNDASPEQHSYYVENGLLRTIDQRSWIRNVWSGQGFDYSLGVNWQIKTNHSIGTRLERHDKLAIPMERRQRTELTQYLSDGSDVRHESNNSFNTERDHTPYNWEGNAYYDGKVGNMGIDLNIDFLTNKATEETTIEEYRNTLRSDYSTANHTSNRMYAGKLVLSYPIWKGQIQVGSEMTFVHRKNAYRVVGLTLPNTDSDVKENNIATFLQYSCQVPKLGNLSAGLRYEHVLFEYKDKLNATNTQSRNTDDLFPTLSWSHQWGSLQSAINYTTKTIRPDYWQLSETTQYINPHSLQQGDPKLNNTTIHSINGHVRYKWANLYLAYEQRNNCITQWSYIYNHQGVILIRTTNLQQPIRNVGAFVTIAPTWGCYSPIWMLGTQKYFNTFTLVDPRVALDSKNGNLTDGEREARYTRPLYYLNLNNTIRLKHSWQWECNASIMTAGDLMNYRLINTSYNVDLVVQKCWLRDDALCLRLSVTDIFQHNCQDLEMDCGYYTLTQHNRSGSHRLNATLRYVFNAQKSKYKGTGAGQDAAGRMKK